MKKLILISTILLSFNIQAQEYRMGITKGIVKSENIIIRDQLNSNNNDSNQPQEPEVVTYASCNEILQAGQSTGDGVYSINNGIKDYNVFCNMTTNGGGWTLVVAQFEQDPVTNWNEGIQPDYDPTLSTGRGFALNTSEIPAHTLMASALSSPSQMNVYGNIFPYQYTTGNIPVTLITNTNGVNYQIHRDTNSRFGNNDPEMANSAGSSQTVNVLTIDVTGRNGFSYAFLPNHGTPSVRGYGYNGERYNINDSMAWAIWVK